VAGLATASLGEGSVVARRYRLERLLGRGGMGVVWQAGHLVTGRRVAIKFLMASSRRDDQRRRFLREARAASAARHPNVVEILDVLELEDGTPALVMELLTGETLRDRLVREGRLTLEATASLFLPVLAAVAAAHSLGIIHRDLKPENVFLLEGAAPGQDVKVLDFGVAKLTTDDGEFSEGGSLTGTGSALGTPYYMAPEQAAGEKDVDARADVWALGVMLYESLAGVRPVEGSGVGGVIMKLMTEGIRPLDERVPGLPGEVVGLVMRMLSRERRERPGNLLEVREVLARFGHAAAIDTRSAQALSSRGRRAPSRAVIGMVAAAVLILLALAARSTGAPGSPSAAAPRAEGATSPAPPAVPRPSPTPPPGEAVPSATAAAPVPPATLPASDTPLVRSVRPAPPTEPRPRSDCDPPYEFDREGRKLWKRQCL
jgi:serine/threonine-protein kinase